MIPLVLVHGFMGGSAQWENQIKDLSPLESLLRLKKLYIYENPNLTLYEVEKLKKALPNCEIFHNTK